MRKPLLLGQTVIALTICWSTVRLFAQCDTGILDYTVTCDTAPNGIVYASRCSNFGGGERPCYACYQGSGVCVKKDGTHVQYYLANQGYQESCPTCTGCCPEDVGCEDPTHFACLESDCNCHLISPIIVDTSGTGFHLTNAESGVLFDMAGDGSPLKMAWTSPKSGNAFLALDRNHDGKIDTGKELFGNFTAQPETNNPNGFLALAEFDKPENGGNGDGIIDGRDAVFPNLRLWIDENHDGVSQANELHTLPELGVFSLGLRYRDDRRFLDGYGNWFHYQAAVNPGHDGSSKDGRVAFDVFLVLARDQPEGSTLKSRNPAGNWSSQKEGFLVDDLPFFFRRVRRIECPQRSRQGGPGGAQ